MIGSCFIIAFKYQWKMERSRRDALFGSKVKWKRPINFNWTQKFDEIFEEHSESFHLRNGVRYIRNAQELLFQQHKKYHLWPRNAVRKRLLEISLFRIVSKIGAAIAVLSIVVITLAFTIHLAQIDSAYCCYCCCCNCCNNCFNRWRT